MYIYKRIIKCPNSIEIEYYQSIKRIGKYYGGRGINKKLSSAKQKVANALRTIRKWAQVIDCNFNNTGWWCRFSAPFGTFDSEEKFLREARNFFDRIKRRCKKKNIVFKYVGFREVGKLGKNWHMHIVLSDEVRKIAQECWNYKNGGMNFTPLWNDANYEKLAEYIRKDVSGQKRMMASRNLTRPEITTRPASQKEILKLAKGKTIEAPKGYYQDKNISTEFKINDITGASWYFKFRPLAFRNNYNGIF